MMKGHEEIDLPKMQMRRPRETTANVRRGGSVEKDFEPLEDSHAESFEIQRRDFTPFDAEISHRELPV